MGEAKKMRKRIENRDQKRINDILSGPPNSTPIFNGDEITGWKVNMSSTPKTRNPPDVILPVQNINPNSIERSRGVPKSNGGSGGDGESDDDDDDDDDNDDD